MIDYAAHVLVFLGIVAWAAFACGFSEPVRPVIIELFLSAFNRSTTDGSPDPDNDSVSYWTVIPCRMHLAMWQLLRLTTIFLRCVPALFRSRNEQALVELALRQQLATFTLKGPKPRITPADRTLLRLMTFWTSAVAVATATLRVQNVARRRWAKLEVLFHAG